MRTSIHTPTTRAARASRAASHLTADSHALLTQWTPRKYKPLSAVPCLEQPQYERERGREKVTNCQPAAHVWRGLKTSNQDAFIILESPEIGVHAWTCTVTFTRHTSFFCFCLNSFNLVSLVYITWSLTNRVKYRWLHSYPSQFSSTRNKHRFTTILAFYGIHVHNFPEDHGTRNLSLGVMWVSERMNKWTVYWIVYVWSRLICHEGKQIYLKAIIITTDRYRREYYVHRAIQGNCK